jgi:hypothetical protein
MKRGGDPVLNLVANNYGVLNNIKLFYAAVFPRNFAATSARTT